MFKVDVKTRGRTFKPSSLATYSLDRDPPKPRTRSRTSSWYCKRACGRRAKHAGAVHLSPWKPIELVLDRIKLPAHRVIAKHRSRKTPCNFFLGSMTIGATSFELRYAIGDKQRNLTALR